MRSGEREGGLDEMEWLEWELHEWQQNTAVVVVEIVLDRKIEKKINNFIKERRNSQIKASKTYIYINI